MKSLRRSRSYFGWWRQYAAADRGTYILDDMTKPANGYSSFSGALPAGEYKVWIQEQLAPGEFDYRFNLLLSPLPEPAPALLLLARLAVLRHRVRAQLVSHMATRRSA